jgi:hypothetical protein
MERQEAHYISRLPMHMASVAALIQHESAKRHGIITYNIVAFQCTWHQLRPSYNMERQEAHYISRLPMHMASVAALIQHGAPRGTNISRLPMHMASVAALIQHGAPRGTTTLVAFQCTWHQLRPSYNMERQEAPNISRLPMHMASVAALIQHGAPIRHTNISRLPMHMASVAALIQHGAPRGISFALTLH